MPVERSAGAIIFREIQKGREYLLLHYPAMTARGRSGGHWDFPKGNIERGEKTEDAVRREVREETGISELEFIPDFKETIRYFVSYDNERRLKFVAYLLARTRKKKVTISWEHQGYEWLPFDEAYERITYKNAKAILKNADDYLRGKGI